MKLTLSKNNVVKSYTATVDGYNLTFSYEHEAGQLPARVVINGFNNIVHVDIHCSISDQSVTIMGIAPNEYPYELIKKLINKANEILTILE